MKHLTLWRMRCVGLAGAVLVLGLCYLEQVSPVAHQLRWGGPLMGTWLEDPLGVTWVWVAHPRRHALYVTRLPQGFDTERVRRTAGSAWWLGRRRVEALTLPTQTEIQAFTRALARVGSEVQAWKFWGRAWPGLWARGGWRGVLDQPFSFLDRWRWSQVGASLQPSRTVFFSAPQNGGGQEMDALWARMKTPPPLENTPQSRPAGWATAQVWNASGRRDAALEAARKLRREGIDVRELGNYPFQEATSIVLDQRNSIEKARFAAQTLEVALVVCRPDPQSPVDMVVVLGKEDMPPKVSP